MLSYDASCKHPAASPSLTGLTRAEFDELAEQSRASEQDRRAAATTTRRDGRPRRNAHGSGHPHRNDARSRLLMAPAWPRTCPTSEALGFSFGLHRRDAQLDVRSALEARDALGPFPPDRPDRDDDRAKLRSPAEVMAASPQVRIIIDAKEQRIDRPEGFEARKPYHSGKEEARTLKARVVVGPRGRIETASDSVPGGANHDLTPLRTSGVPDRLGGGEAAMMDRGYVGVKASHPGVPIVIPRKASRGHPLTEGQVESDRVVARHRVVVGHTMAQLGRFTVLRQVSRGRRRERHGGVVRVVARLVKRRAEVRPLKSHAA